MNDKYLTEIMHAYAAGCLDHEDLIPFLDMMSTNGDITNPDLGELQNLTSLLPAILMIENPPVSAKDNIARRLYAIKEEMLAKKNLERNVIQKKSVPGEEILSERMTKHESTSPIEYTEPKYSDAPFQSGKIQEEPKPRPQSVHEQHYVPHSAPEKKESRVTLIALIVIFVLLIAGASAGVYSLLQKKIDEQKKNLAALNSNINVLNDEIIRLNKTQRILGILGSKDVSTINLDGTIDNPTGFGKIVFDPASKEGLLSLFNMPALPKEKSYQLWLLSKGQPFSLGLFNLQKDAARYIPIEQFPDIPLNNIDAFLVTAEDALGSDSPKGTVYLSSTVKKSR